MDKSWITISSNSLDKLKEAKNELHRFVQLVAATGRSFQPSDPGDFYGSLIFKAGVLWGKALPNGHQFGLDLAGFSLINSEGNNFPLENRSPNDGILWIKRELASLNYNPDQYAVELPYEIPDYGSLDLKSIPIENNYYQVYSAFYTNANLVLTQLMQAKENSSDVICWPHHFDIATLVILKEGSDPENSISIGIGLSPGDDNYDQPYFYLTPWPYPSASVIDNLKLDHGFWHTAGWIGAILTMENMAELDNQHTDIEDFINKAYEHLESALL